MLEPAVEALELPAGTTSRKRVFEDNAQSFENISLMEASNVASDVSRKRIKAVSKLSSSTISESDFVANTVSKLHFPMASSVGWNVGVQGALRTSFGSKKHSSAIMRSQYGWDVVKMLERKKTTSPDAALQQETLSIVNFSSEDDISSAEHGVSACSTQSPFNKASHEFENKFHPLQDGHTPILKEQSFTRCISRDSPVLANLSRQHGRSSNTSINPNPLRREGSSPPELQRMPISQIMDFTIPTNPEPGQVEQLPRNTISQPFIDKSNNPEIMPQINTDSSKLTKQEVSALVDENHKQRGLWKKEGICQDSFTSEQQDLNECDRRKRLCFEEDWSEAVITQDPKDPLDVDVKHSRSTTSSGDSVEPGRFSAHFEKDQEANIPIDKVMSTSSSISIAEMPEPLPSDTEAFLQMKYFPQHNDTARVLRCLACASRYHRTWNCSGVSCVLCEEATNHFDSPCPLRQRCEKCRELGHLTIDCPEKLSRAKGEGVPCDLCGSMKHVESGCDLIWRSFLPRLDEIQTIHELPIHCYSCGASGHFGPECGLHTGPLLSGPRTWTKENYLKYVGARNQQRAISILCGPTGDGRAQGSFKIRGKANDLDAPRGEVDADICFIQPIVDTAASMTSQNTFKGAPEQDFRSNSLLNLKNCSPRKSPLSSTSTHIIPPNFESTNSDSPRFQYPLSAGHLVDQVINPNLGTHPHSFPQFENRACEQNRAISALPNLVEASLPLVTNAPKSKVFSGKGEERRRGRGGGRRGKSKRLRRPALKPHMT